MIFAARVCIPIIATVTALLGALALLLLVVAPGSLSLQTGFHWLLLASTVAAASFSIYSFIYLFFGSDPRRQIQVLISAFAFLVLYLLFQSPSAGSFIRSVVH
jgi:hypothetical protein